MAAKKPLIGMEEIDFSLINKAFEDEPHDIYVMYDEESDEFIMKLEKPKSPTTIYHIRDNVGLIVVLNNKKAIGLIFFNFVKDQFSLWKTMNDQKKQSFIEYYKKYQKIEYDPKNNEREIPDFFIYKTEKTLEKELAIV